MLLTTPNSLASANIANPVQATKVTNALKFVKTLKARDMDPHDGYSRGKFSSGWGKIQQGDRVCDLRNYVLTRDLTKITRKADNWCLVATGQLKDPYTGAIIQFVRGVKTSNAVQIDHVVALSNAWGTGAQSLTETVRFQIANDPLNLLAVDGPTNGSKSDKDASRFLPPRSAYHCKYVARQLAVKKKYRLFVTSGEKSTMIRVLTSCPKQNLP